MAQRGIFFRRFRYGRPFKRTQAGFTLHDTLITVGIAGTLISATPSLRNMLQENALVTTVNLLRTDLSLVRSEALRRGYTVTLCKSRSGTGCERDAEWHHGWIIFADPNDNGTRDAEEALLRIQGNLGPGITLNLGAARNADNDVRYHATGSSEKNGTFTFCDPRGPTRARAIVLNFVGRPYISTLKPSGEILECPSAPAS